MRSLVKRLSVRLTSSSSRSPVQPRFITRSQAATATATSSLLLRSSIVLMSGAASIPVVVSSRSFATTATAAAAATPMDVKSAAGDGAVSTDATVTDKSADYFRDLLAAPQSGGGAISIPARGSDIEILSTPTQFYDEVMRLTQSARERVCLSSLYIGTGKLELDFVNALVARCNALGSATAAGTGADSKAASVAAASPLRVHVLLDHGRGLRGHAQQASSLQLLAPILNAYPASTTLSFFQTPAVGNWLFRQFLRGRSREILGVHHMKLYIFDDTLIISGANLSDTYFTNRQDRYIVFRNNRALCDYYAQFMDTMSEWSFIAAPKTLALALRPNVPAPESPEFAAQFAPAMMKALRRTVAAAAVASPDTWVYPTLQMGAFGIQHDEQLTCEVFSACAGSPPHQRGTGQLTLATGYMNLTPKYYEHLFPPHNSATTKLAIVAAAPAANGFHNAAGLSYYVPKLYSVLMAKLANTIRTSGDTERAEAREWSRDTWSYHAKGLWYTPGGASWPVVSSIGSPNFGRRSVSKDTETQLFVVTKHTDLRQRLAIERDAILARSAVITPKHFQSPMNDNDPDKQLSPIMKIAARLLREYF